MIKLMDYLPDYYNGVYEMEVIMRAQGGVLDELAAKQVRTLLNEFVTQTDARGIAVFEDQIGVKPESGDDLRTRQNRVLMHLLPPRPITIRYLRELFRTLQLPITINVDYPKREAIVEAKRSDINDRQIGSLKYILNVYLPANMAYQVVIALQDAKVTNDLKVGIGMWTGAQAIALANRDYIIMLTQSGTRIVRNVKLGIGTWAKAITVVAANLAQFENEGV